MSPEISSGLLEEKTERSQGHQLTEELASLVRSDLLKAEIDEAIGVHDFTSVEGFRSTVNRLFGFSEEELASCDNTFLILPAIFSAVYIGSMNVDRATAYVPELAQYKAMIDGWQSVSDQKEIFDCLAGFDLENVAGLWKVADLRRAIRIVLGVGGGDNVLPKKYAGGRGAKQTIYPQQIFNALLASEKNRLEIIENQGNGHHLGIKRWYQSVTTRERFTILREACFTPLSFLNELLAGYQGEIDKLLNYSPVWQASELEIEKTSMLLDECRVLVDDLGKRYVEVVKKNQQVDEALFLDPASEMKAFSRFRGFLIDRKEEEALMRLNDLFLGIRDSRRPDSNLGTVYDQVLELAQQAREIVVLANIGIVYDAFKEVGGFKNGIAEDLIEDGLVSVLENALDKYDVSKGYRFATYARWWALQAIEKAKHGKYYATIRIPRIQVAEQRMVEVYRQKMASGEFPGNGNIDEEIKRVEERIARGMEIREKYGGFLDIDNLPRSMQPHTEAADAGIAKGTLAADLETVLTVRQQRIVELRYGLTCRGELNQKETGQLLGVSRGTVSAEEKKALERLREHYYS